LFKVSKLKNTALSFLKAVMIALMIAAVTLSSAAKSASSLDNAGYSGSNLWDNLRYSFRLKDEYNRPEVQTQIKWLEKHHAYLKQLGKQSQPYLYYILQEVKKRNMPGEIALLPMIESAYNPFAYSHSGAAGLWQFTAGTGTNFGLKRNWWFDGRRDIYNSTNAALNYLSYLHRFFNGNWMLALAAYHSGEGTVKNAVQYNSSHRRSTNFWSLNLPQDTHSYVPKLLALARIIESRQPSVKQLPYIPNTPYFTKVNVGTQIDLTNAAKLAGMSYPELIKLNPGNNHWTTAPQGPHTIVLPLNKVNQFVTNLEKIPENQRPKLANHSAKIVTNTTIQRDQLIRPTPQGSAPASRPALIPAAHANTPHKILHVVQKGDSLWRLSQKYKVKENAIRTWNHLSKSSMIKPGQKLTVWTKGIDWQKKNNIVRYKIKSGDSLSSIAHRYNVSVKKLMSWNTHLQPTRLRPGKEVVIYL